MYAYGTKERQAAVGQAAGHVHLRGGGRVRPQVVYTGTYDGNFFALDAATGDEKWKYARPGAVHSPPTVMGGLVYFAHLLHLRRRGGAPRSSAAPTAPTRSTARTGKKVVWENNAGQVRQPDRRRRRSACT